MIELGLGTSDGPADLRVLFIGAHSDDIEIGCGGTVLRLVRERPEISIHWVVLAADGEREAEAHRSAARFLQGAKDIHVAVHSFRDGFLPYEGYHVKEVFEDLKDVRPDVVFTHRSEDRHQDHRLLSELTWNTFRNQLVLEYEIPKYDADLGSPNVFVELEEDIVQLKIEFLVQEFGTQKSKHWFAPDTFRGLMRLRGVEGAIESGSAEGFYVRKVRLALS